MGGGLNIHEVVWSAAGQGSECGRRRWCRRDAVEVEAAVDGEVHGDVGHGAVGAVPTPALACLPGH